MLKCIQTVIQHSLHYNICLKLNTAHHVGPVKCTNPETLLSLLPRRPALEDTIEIVFQKEGGIKFSRVG